MNSRITGTSPDHYFLDRDSLDSRAALDSGMLEVGDEKIPVRAVALLDRANGRVEVLFRRRTPSRARTLEERLKRIFITIRGFSLTATLMPCLAILLLGMHQGYRAEPAIAISALAGVLFLQIAVNLYNDVTDYLKLIDLPGSPGGSGVFELGWFSPREIRGYAHVMAGAGFLAGLPALFAYPLEIFMAGGLGLIGMMLYSHGRFGLKYHALGDVAVFVLCGPALTAGYSYAAFGELIPGFLPTGALLGLLACGLLHMNNLHDMELDASRGVSTLAIRLGFKTSVTLLGLLYLAAALILVAATTWGTLPPLSLLAILAFGQAVGLYRTARTALGPISPTLEGSRMKAAQIHLAAGLLLCVGIFGTRWTGG